MRYLSFVSFFAIVLYQASAFAQACPQDNSYQPVPLEGLLHASTPDMVLRYAAISGNDLAPSLIRLSKPGMAVDTIEGAAQVSLARLGEQSALKQLRDGLNNPNTSFLAYPKLVRAGTDAAVADLMAYLRVHLHDDSLHHDFGDYTVDERSDIVDAISQQLQIGPMTHNGFFGGTLQQWLDWWDQNKAKPVTLSISGYLHGPHLKCLARKVEWGFPDAIFDLAQTRDPQVIPILTILAKWSNPKRRPFVVTTLQGRAQLGLARLGDQEELQTVKRELDLSGLSSAIEELRLLGGPTAVSMLIDALDSPSYLPEYRGRPSYDKLRFERDELILKALTALVISPPRIAKPAQSKQIWETWWKDNKNDLAKFVQYPVRKYE